mgnify:CR=1 FL=1
MKTLTLILALVAVGCDDSRDKQCSEMKMYMNTVHAGVYWSPPALVCGYSGNRDCPYHHIVISESDEKIEKWTDHTTFVCVSPKTRKVLSVWRIP